MFKNYLLTAWRNLLVNPTSSIINIAGLAIAICCCMLALLYADYESSYDSHFPDHERIFRVQGLQKIPQMDIRTTDSIPKNIVDELAKIPEVAEITTLDSDQRFYIQHNGVSYLELGRYTDQDFFSIFKTTALYGDLASALDGPNKVVITQSLARKLFGTDNAVGKTFIKIPASGEYKEYITTVTGVIADLPQSTHLVAKIFSAYKGSDREQLDNRFRQQGRGERLTITYIKLPQETKASAIEDYLNNLLSQNETGIFKIKLQPLNTIHLEGPAYEARTGAGYFVISNYQVIIGSLALAALLLAIAIANFINISTAQASLRTREVAMRKTAGARPGHIFIQFMIEKTLYVTLAAVLASGLIQLALPWFRKVSSLPINSDMLTSPLLLLAAAGALLFTIIFSGLYPAWKLAHLQPLDSLKGGTTYSSRGILRKVLLTGQFTIATALIIVTVFFNQQLNLLGDREFGYNTSNLFTLNTFPTSFEIQQTFTSEAVKHSSIDAVSFYDYPYFAARQKEARFANSDQDFTQIGQILKTDNTFLECLQIPLLAGRNFDTAIKSDFTKQSFPHPPTEGGALVATPALLHALGIENYQQALGKTIEIRNYVDPEFIKAHPGAIPKSEVSYLQYTIIGVAGDFDLGSHSQAMPFNGMTLGASMVPFVTVKTNKPLDTEIRKYIGNIWQKLTNRKQTGNFVSTEQTLETEFQNTERLISIINLLTFIAITIACLGLYAMAAFSVQRRTQEIGVRKVLGASAGNIVALLIRDFAKPIAIALAIAVMPAWLASDWLLQFFSVRIDMSVWVVFVAALVTALIGLITVSGYTWRAAHIDPALTLKVE